MTAYAGLFAWSFLAATILPLASEPALLLLVRSREALLGPVIVATAGNTLGACTTYWLARKAVSAFDAGGRVRDRAALRVVERYGQPALLLSWVPLLGDAIVATAGAASMKFGWFVCWTLVGKAARYLAVAYLALW